MCSIWAAGSKLVGHAVALAPSSNSLNVRTSEAAMSSGAEGNSPARLRNTKREAGPPIVTMRSRSRSREQRVQIVDQRASLRRLAEPLDLNRGFVEIDRMRRLRSQLLAKLRRDGVERREIRTERVQQQHAPGLLGAATACQDVKKRRRPTEPAKPAHCETPIRPCSRWREETFDHKCKLWEPAPHFPTRGTTLPEVTRDVAETQWHANLRSQCCPDYATAFDPVDHGGSSAG